MHVRMMPTLLIRVLIGGKFIGRFRALADSGAEANLVHYKTIKYWYSHSTSAHVSVIGLGEQNV